MILWYAAGAVVVVWAVFQTTGLDFRLVALGALLPVLVDLPAGHRAIGHTLLASAVLLLVVMLATAGRGRRLRRRRLLSLPIGSLSGLVLAAAWRDAEVFWWPALGTDLGRIALLPPWPAIVVLETIGLVAALWAVGRFGLADPDRRRRFLTTGRLDARAL